jgi:hypothetical protein
MRSITRFPPIEHAAGTDLTLGIGLFADNGDTLEIVGGMSAAWKLYRAVPRRGRKPFKGNPVLEKTSAAGGVTLTDGNAAVAIAAADLAGKSGVFWQTLAVTDAGGDVACYGQGEVLIRAAA